MRRSSADISNVRTRRTLYLSIVRPVLGYPSQIWCPQSIGLVKRAERAKRRASKFMLNLLFLCDVSYRERLIALDLMPLSYWHEYMDLVFFKKNIKAIKGMVNISQDVLPKPLIPMRITRSSSSNCLSFHPQKCRTNTFQRSYFSRVKRVWNCLQTDLRQPNTLLSTFERLLREYYSKALGPVVSKAFSLNGGYVEKTAFLHCKNKQGKYF